MSDSRDGFPCWIGCDAHGVRCWSWESVRLVEWIPVPTLEDMIREIVREEMPNNQ